MRLGASFGLGHQTETQIRHEPHKVFSVNSEPEPLVMKLDEHIMRHGVPGKAGHPLNDVPLSSFDIDLEHLRGAVPVHNKVRKRAECDFGFRDSGPFSSED